MKIALCGPPRSGKSVLRERLKQAIRRLDPAVYPYVITANPDGEGAWFQRAFQTDPGAAQSAKAQAKQRWTDAHADLYAAAVRNVSVPLTFIDLGGIADDKNLRICALATHAILLAPTAPALEEWRTFSELCGLTVLAELLSDYQGEADVIEAGGAFPAPTTPPQPLRASVHHLERGELEGDRPAVEILARLILDELHRHQARHA